MRIFLTVILGIGFLMSPAFAGFEWIPEKPRDMASAPNVQNVLQAPIQAIPAPAVEAVPMSILNSSPSASGRLVINPYPLATDLSIPMASSANLEMAMMAQIQSNVRPSMSQPASYTPQSNIRRDTVTTMDQSLTPLPNNKTLPPLNLSAVPQVPIEKAPEPVLKPTPQPGFEDAVGFGKDLPLALVIDQIVPDDYTYTVDDSVDLDTFVSWEGGRPWNDVLRDTLKSQGLQARIDGNQVTIEQELNSAAAFLDQALNSIRPASGI